MERLIFEYVEGDGCTYSCTNTYPVVYENKEKAISDLESILLERQIKMEEAYKKLDENYNLLEKARNSILKLQGRKGKESELEKATKEFQTLQINNHEISMSITDEFNFANQTFYYSHFIEKTSEGKIFIAMPDIYTLDEFFAKVEN